jgi:cytochrome c-type biogenesis protein CcmH/NrfG
MRTLVLTGAVLGFYAAPGLLEALGDETFLPWILGEDGVYESMGALACLAAAMLFASLFLADRRRPPASIPGRRGPLLALLAVGLFFIFAEEVNWGQRLLGLAAPAWLYQFNSGGEMALHVMGSYAAPMIATAALGFAALGYLSLLPLLASRSARVRAWTEYWDLPLASPSVAWANAALFVVAVSGLAASRIGHFDSEQYEAPLQVLFLLHAVGTFRRRAALWPPLQAKRIAAAVASVALLAAGGFALDALSSNRVPASYHFIWAMESASRGDQAAFTARLHRVLELDPSHVGGLSLLAGVAMEQGALETAAVLMERAVALAPRNPKFHSALSWVRESQGSIEQAAALAEQAVQLDPNNLEYRISLVRLLDQLHRPADAAPHLEFLDARLPADHPMRQERPFSVAED